MRACVYACVSLSVVIAAPLTRFGRRMGRMHCDSEHRSLTRLLRTARFARAPLRSFARSLAHSLAPELMGQWNIFVQFSMCPKSQWNDYEIDTEYCAIHSSARSFTRTAHSFAFSALLTSLARSAALIHLFAHSPIHSLQSTWASGFKMRPRISIGGSVSRSVGPSIHPSVRP